MAKRIRAHYADLGQAAQAMSAEAANIQQMEHQLKGRVQDLHSKGWNGQGSDAFFKEMEQLVLPAIHRCHDALENNAQAINKIHSVFSAADDDVSQLFKQQSGGV
jgi:WXG100 family type VII secretion target